MEAQNELSLQEQTILHILQTALEQEQSLEDQIDNPPSGGEPQPVLTPEGWIMKSTPLPDEAIRVASLKEQIADIKSTALSNIQELSRSLPDADRERIDKDATIVLYTDQDVQNNFYDQKDLDTSQEVLMSALANAEQDKNTIQEASAIREKFTQFFVQNIVDKEQEQKTADPDKASFDPDKETDELSIRIAAYFGINAIDITEPDIADGTGADREREPEPELD